MKHKVRIRRTEEGYCASCPKLPGCWSQGDTLGQALDNIAVAIGEWFLVAGRWGIVADEAREIGVPAAELYEVEVAADEPRMSIPA